MPLDFQEESAAPQLDFQVDFQPDDAQGLQQRYSGAVNEMTQEKPQSHGMPTGSFRGGMVEGATHSPTYNTEVALAAKTGDRSAFGAESDVPGIPNAMALTPEEEKSFDTSKDYNQRAQILSAARQRAIDSTYGDASRDTWSATIGRFIGGLAVDPTTYAFPAGNGIKAAAIAGGAFGAAQSASEALSEGKAIDPTDVAVTTAISAAGGVVVQKALDIAVPAIKSVVDRAMKMGNPLNAKTLEQGLKDEGVPSSVIAQTNTEQLAGNLNSEFKLNGLTPEQVKLNQKLDNTVGLSTEDADIVNANFYGGLADNFKVEYNLPKKPFTETRTVPGTPATKAKIDSNWDYVPAKEATPSKTYEVTNPNSDLGYDNLTTKPKYFKADMTLGENVDYTNLVDNLDNYSMKKGVKPSIDVVPVGTRDVYGTKVNTKGKVVDNNYTLEPNAEALDKAFADQMSAKQEVYSYFKDAVPVGSPTYNKIATEALEAKGGLSANAYTVQGLEDGLVLGAIQNKEVPWTGEIASTAYPPIGDKPLDFKNPDPSTLKSLLIKFHEVSGNILTAPWKAFESVNAHGKMASKMFDDALVNSHARVGTHAVEYDQAISKFGIEAGSPEEQMAADVLRGILKPGEVKPKVLEFAQFMHGKFSSELKDAAKVGLITQDTLQKLLAKGTKNGYFPRVWNNDFLDTSAGKKLWEERLSGHAFTSEAGAKEAYASITGTGTGGDVPIGVNKVGDEYFIPIDMIKKAWLERGKSMASMRSGHLEATRKIPEHMEELLKPFLEQDVKAVFGKYMKEVGTQIEYTKVFGGIGADGKFSRDANAVKLYQGISKDSPVIGNQFLEAYYQGVGDYTNSKNLAGFLSKPEAVRNTLGKLNAIETLHMLMSQTMNLGQTVNALVKVTAADGLTTGDIFRVWGKGLSQGFKAIGDKGLQTEIDKFGATIDHVMIDTLSGLNGQRNTILGKEFEGIFKPINYLNNPEKFLKATGFLSTEAFNRRTAHTVGIAYTEQLLSRKAKMLAEGSRVNPKNLEQINKALEEMGIDRNLDPTKISRAIIERGGPLANKAIDDMIGKAGQRFSNKTNFVNASHTMPIFSSSFMGRMMYKFKSFSLHQSQFIIDNVIKPATRGNLKPLATMMAVGTPVGMGLDSFRRWVLQDDKDFTLSERVLRGAGAIGGLTMMSDTYQAASQSTAGLVTFAAGPGASDVSKAAYGATQGPTGFAKQLATISPGTKALWKHFANDKQAFEAQFDKPQKEDQFK